MSKITYIDIATEDGTILRLLASAIAGWTINEADGDMHELEVEFRSRDVHNALQEIKEGRENGLDN